VNVSDAGGNERLCARRRATEVATWLQINIERRPARVIAGLSQRKDFRMRLTGPLMKSLTDNPIIFDQHRAHHWIGAGAAPGLFGQSQRPLHEIVCRHIQFSFPRSLSKTNAPEVHKGLRGHTMPILLIRYPITQQTALLSTFSHPDCTVGSGFSPDQLRCSVEFAGLIYTS
jgi:hypothetical protein